MNRRISLFGLLIVTVLTVIAFTGGIGSAQTTGSSTAGSGSAVATRPASGSVVATVAPAATRAATVPATAVATGTGGGTTVPVTPTTGQARVNSVNFLLIEGLVLGLAVIGTGVMLRRQATRE